MGGKFALEFKPYGRKDFQLRNRKGNREVVYTGPTWSVFYPLPIDPEPEVANWVELGYALPSSSGNIAVGGTSIIIQGHIPPKFLEALAASGFPSKQTKVDGEGEPIVFAESWDGSLDDWVAMMSKQLRIVD